MSSLFQKAAFFPALFYNVAVDKMTSRNWYDRINDHIILGGLISRSMISPLKTTENLVAVLSLNENFELNSWWYPTEAELQGEGVDFLQLPVQDYTSVPTDEQVEQGIAFVKKWESKGGTVYIHCKGGKVRSAYFTAAYLVCTGNMDPDSAVDFVREKRHHIRLGDKDLTALQEYAKSRKTHGHAPASGVTLSSKNVL